MLSHLLFANGLNVSLLPLDKRCSPATPRSQVTLSFKYLLAIVHKMLLLLQKCMG